jgi:hypothetical protein
MEIWIKRGKCEKEFCSMTPKKNGSKKNVKFMRWTYEAELDYAFGFEKGTWVLGFLNEEGAPFECPHSSDPKLIEKLRDLERLGLDKRLWVTVKINRELDEYGKQYPILIDIRPSPIRQKLRDSSIDKSTV